MEDIVYQYGRIGLGNQGIASAEWKLLNPRMTI